MLTSMCAATLGRQLAGAGDDKDLRVMIKSRVMMVAGLDALASHELRFTLGSAGRSIKTYGP